MADEIKEQAGVPKQERVCEVYVDEAWQELPFSELRAGYIFRVFEPDGTRFATPDGCQVFLCKGDADPEGGAEADPYEGPPLKGDDYVPPPPIKEWEPALVDAQIQNLVQLTWTCRNPACKQVCASIDQNLVQALTRGKTPAVVAPCCGVRYRLAKPLTAQGNRQQRRAMLASLRGLKRVNGS